MRASLAAAFALSACVQPRPIEISYGYTSFVAQRESIQIEVTRSCDITFTETDRLPRKGTLEAADCSDLFVAAAAAGLTPEPRCPVVQIFSAGVAVRLSDGAALHACYDDPFTIKMKKLAEQYAPALRRVALPEGLCDPVDCPKRNTGPYEFEEVGSLSKDANGCVTETSRECRRSGAGAACAWTERQARRCPSSPSGDE